MTREQAKDILKELEISPRIWHENSYGRYYQLTYDIHPQFSAHFRRLVKRALAPHNCRVTFESSPYVTNQSYLMVDIFCPEFEDN